VVTKLDTNLPENAQITFILTGQRLVTNRYVDPLPFRRFVAHTDRHPQSNATAQAVLAGLLEFIVNRIADVIERVGADIDTASAEIFNRQKLMVDKQRRTQRDFRKLLEHIGQSGELIAKARESLASLSRLLAFAQQSTIAMSPEVRTRLRTLSKDVVAMSDHASFLGTNLNFVLDATLGMINIDQNNILKIFSVVTVFLLPPSVIGAMFGMNFAHIPTLQEPWGFWAALALMVLSSVLPYLWFRQRGWL
jgi:magnesium transporter